MIFINFKNYEEATRENAIKLVKILRECEEILHVSIIPVVRSEDSKSCVEVGREVWVQYTNSPQSLVEVDVKGTFLNHSDHRLDQTALRDLVSQCRETGIKTLVFAANITELKLVLELKPQLVAFEPPELIASPTTSVAREKPEIISQAVKNARDFGVPLIVGAGIKDGNDVKKSLELGAVGVAVSSAVVLAKDPKAVVLKLAKGFK